MYLEIIYETLFYEMVFMKIAIFTLIGRGPGTKLQNYALQTYLEKEFAADVKTIRRTGYYYYPLTIKNSFRNFSLKEFAKLILQKNFRQYIVNEKKLQPNWLAFDKNIKYTDYVYKQNSGAIAGKLDNMFDYFCVGSDQVWNFNWYADINYFKYFDSSKCFSYAASFGVYEIDAAHKKNVSETLAHLSGISIREDAGVKIAKQLTGNQIERNIDPTFLLSKDDWVKVYKKPKHYIKEDYIVAFFLGDIAKERHNKIEKLAKENNCKIMWIMKKEFPLWEDIGPAEFLYVIAHAKGVVTDSFHGTAFSIIFRKPFYVLNRKQNLNNMNSRLDTILELFNLKNRHVLDNDMCFDRFLINYKNNVDEIISYEQQKAKNYFANMLRK